MIRGDSWLGSFRVKNGINDFLEIDSFKRGLFYGPQYIVTEYINQLDDAF